MSKAAGTLLIQNSGEEFQESIANIIHNDIIKQLKDAKMFSMPDIYINEDLTRARATLLYKACKATREKGIADCWSFDGRVVIKDVCGKVHTIGNEVSVSWPHFVAGRS